MSLEYVREKALQDLLDAERVLRQQAEEQNRALRDVLYFLAQRLAGDQVERIRRGDPAAFRVWTPEQWRQFFAGLLLNFDNRSGWQRGNGSKGNGSKGTSEALEQARRENERLKRQLQTLEARLRQMEEEIEKARAEPEAAPPPPPPEADDSPRPGCYEEWLQALHEIRRQPPRIPSRVRQAFARNPIARTRQVMALHLVAVRGVALRLEMDYLVATAEGVKVRSGAMRRRVEDLVEHGLLLLDKLPLEQRRFVVLRLSDEGRRVAEQMFGKPPVENEWERLMRLHEGERFPQHTAAVLVTAAQARIRGYRAEVLPQVESPSPPDLLIEKAGERLFVEVELGRKERPAKWEHNAALNGGTVALVAGTAQRRGVLVADIKRMGLSGMATDLVYLLKTPLAEITPEDGFWVEEWLAP